MIKFSLYTSLALFSISNTWASVRFADCGLLKDVKANKYYEIDLKLVG